MAADRHTSSGRTISSFPASDYRALIVAYRNGAPVRLSEVAAVVDGAENVSQAAWMNQTPAIIVNVQRQPGANIIEVVESIKELLPQAEASLPTAVHSPFLLTAPPRFVLRLTRSRSR